ncbi:unnamed protein product [Urochloa humidicola]
MGPRRRSKSNRKKARADDGSGDRLTALPLELRAQIASLLHFRQIVQLSVLSRPWRHIHHHAPVVKLHLHRGHGFPDGEDDSILAASVTLARRTHDASASNVDILRLGFADNDPRMRRHAGRIVMFAGAREIRIRLYTLINHVVPMREAWMLDLPSSARELEIVGAYHLAPAVTAAALSKLSLGGVVIREWPPLLPSLRSLNLERVTVETSFASGTWCPRLEELDVFNSKIEHARIEIRLPHLRFLRLDKVNVSPRGEYGGGNGVPPIGDIAIDDPSLRSRSRRFPQGDSGGSRAPRRRHPHPPPYSLAVARAGVRKTAQLLQGRRRRGVVIVLAPGDVVSPPVLVVGNLDGRPSIPATRRQIRHSPA